MLTERKPRFSISTPSWLVICAAMFCGGRWWYLSQLPPKRQFDAESKVIAEQAETIELLNAELRERLTAIVVIAVAEGDTVSTVVNKELTRVRIVGIDCPESNQPFGDEAKQFTANFCMKKDVELVGDEEDRYGRRLADVVVRGQSLRETLLSAGLAWHYKKYSDDPDLARLEDEARAAKRGLWANEDSVPPWEWRGQN